MKPCNPDIPAKLKAGTRWLISSHANPDGDAVGSVLGLDWLLRELGREPRLLNQTPVPEMYRFLPGWERIQPEVDWSLDYDGIVILDSGTPDRIGPVSQKLDRFPLVINIDHHISPQPWGDLRWVDTTASAVGEMIHHLAQLMDAPIGQEAAECLYTAIMTDTGSFRYGNTTPQSLAIAADLAAKGADPGTMARQVYLTYGYNRLDLMARTLSRLKLRLGGRLGLMTVDQKDFIETGTTASELEGFVDLARGVRGVEVALMIREQEGGYKFSIRTNDLVDAAALAQRYGGGGHKRAAGVTINRPKEEAIELIVDAAREALDG